MPRSRSAAVLAATLALSACASTEADPKTPTTSTPRQVDDGAAPPQPNATVSVASVQMIEDCPHQDAAAAAPEPPTPDEAAQTKRSAPMPPDPSRAAQAKHDMAPGDSLGGDIDQCTQSTMQLQFTSTGQASAQVKIVATRIRRADTDAVLDDIKTRSPQRWTKDGRYEAWDETVAPGDPTKASYKLSVPDWAKVHGKTDGKSFGMMFELEVDVEIDGVRSTVVSPEFTREEPHVIVT